MLLIVYAAQTLRTKSPGKNNTEKLLHANHLGPSVSQSASILYSWLRHGCAVKATYDMLVDTILSSQAHL